MATMVMWSGEGATIVGLTAGAHRYELAPNVCRYGGDGHVESYFLRANDPQRPRAIWIKSTIWAPLVGAPIAEAWVIWFDAEEGRALTFKSTESLAEASFEDRRDGRTAIDVGGLELMLGHSGSARGSVRDHGESASLDLMFTRADNAVAGPLSIYPWRALREGPFPKSKLLTPFPWLWCSGRVVVAGETIELDRWPGMQGHNWGREHADEYAWGQCLFPRRNDEPEAMLEGFSGRVMIAGRLTPRMSALVVRRGTRSYRFDRIFDFWRQTAEIEGGRWSLHLTSRDGEARLEMDATDRPFACLPYLSPNGRVSSCLNSKLARVLLQVQPTEGPAFELTSEHGGALELLGPATERLS